MVKLSQLESGKAISPFCMSPASYTQIMFMPVISSDVSVHFDNERIRLEVTLSDCDILSDSKQRKCFEHTTPEDIEWYTKRIEKARQTGKKTNIAGKNHQWRCSAGGILYLDGNDNDKIITILRDNKAPSYPEHLTLASGLSTSIDEILNPGLIALREGAEEYLITSPGKVQVPMVGEKGIGLEIFLAEAERQNMDFYDGKLSVIEINAELLRPKEYDEIIIKDTYGNKHITQCILALDPATRGFDALQVVRVFPEGDYKIEDGEKPFGIDREIRKYSHSDIHNEKMTPVLEQAVKKLNWI